MKNLITLLALLMFGTASVFAQYDCDVSWTYPSGADCTPDNLPSQGTYYIKVTLEIYDWVNDKYPTGANPPVKILSTSATSTNFSAAQCGVSAYCDESHNDTPEFYITATVAFVSSTSQEHCSSSGQNLTGYSCNDFYNGIAYVEVVMD